MWNFVFCLILGFIGGILGGMGMGGGTLLIPLLTIFLSFSQHLAQAVNLVSFIPMAIIALILHVKNKLVRTSGILYIIIPSLLASILSRLLSNSLDGDFLKHSFAIFLITLSVIQFFSNNIIRAINKRKIKLKK
jgi:uncharacterized membrane protein YfcA